MEFISLFGSLNEEPEKKPEESQEPEEKKSGFFGRMRDAVTRTRESFSSKIEGIVSMTRQVDERDLEELESALITSDIGVQTTTEIIEALRDRARRQAIEGGAELRDLLKAQLIAILSAPKAAVAAPPTPPRVIFLVGVNGTGKTTTSGKLAAWSRAQDRTVLLRLPTPSAPRPLNNWKSGPRAPASR